MFYVLWRAPVVAEDGEPYGYFHVHAENLEDTEWPWEQGGRLPSPPDKVLRLRVKTDDQDARVFADYVFGSIPLVSERLRRVWDSFGISNVEYFATQVSNRDQAVGVPCYFAFNIVGKVGVVDESASSVEMRPFGGSGATMYKRMAVDAQAAVGLDVFRMAENTGTILVSERVAQACIDAGLDTLKFVPTDKWQH